MIIENCPKCGGTHIGSHECPYTDAEAKAHRERWAGSPNLGNPRLHKPPTVDEIKLRQYECFMEDHEPKRWTPGQCAGFAGSGSRALHLFRCKRKDGHGIGGLFCAQHAKTGGF